MELGSVSEQNTIIAETYCEFMSMLTEEEQQNIKHRIQHYIDQMMCGEFQVVVMGEIKKGKSSFISALLGEYDLLPTDSDVATSTVYKIKYGPARKYTVIFKPEAKKQPQEITQEQIPEYGTEKGNEGNEKQVALIRVEMPNPLLEKGLVIVDTPGLGGIFKNHRGITLEYAPYADAVFFVVDSVESVINEDEIKLLKDMYKVTKNIYFVQTKTDDVGAEVWESWRERNVDILTTSDELKEFKLTKDQLIYFTVSSKLKKFADEESESDESVEDLEQSGFLKINDFLFNDLLVGKNKKFTERALRHLVSEIQYCESQARDRLENVKEQNKQAITDKESEIEEILRKLEEWKEGSWKDVASKFSYMLSQETASCKNKIYNALSPEQPNFQNKIEAIKNEFDSVSDLIEQGDEIIGNHIVFCAETGKNIIVQYFAEVEKSIHEISRKSLSDFEQITRLGDIQITRTSLDVDKTFSYTWAAVDVAAGGVVGGAVAGGMWWGLVGAAHAVVFAGSEGSILIGVASAAGPLGWAAIGAVGLLGAAGTFWGSNKIRNIKKLKAALVKLSHDMEEISLQAMVNFRPNIDTLAQEIKSGTVSMIEAVEAESRHEIEAMLADIKKTKQLTEEEAANEVRKRQDYLKKIRGMVKQLSTIN